MAETKKIEIPTCEDPMQDESYIELLKQGHKPKFIERDPVRCLNIIFMEKEDGKV